MKINKLCRIALYGGTIWDEISHLSEGYPCEGEFDEKGIFSSKLAQIVCNMRNHLDCPINLKKFLTLPDAPFTKNTEVETIETLYKIPGKENITGTVLIMQIEESYLEGKQELTGWISLYRNTAAHAQRLLRRSPKIEDNKDDN